MVVAAQASQALLVEVASVPICTLSFPHFVCLQARAKFVPFGSLANISAGLPLGGGECGECAQKEDENNFSSGQNHAAHPQPKPDHVSGHHLPTP